MAVQQCFAVGRIREREPGRVVFLIGKVAVQIADLPSDVGA